MLILIGFLKVYSGFKQCFELSDNL